MAAPSSSTTPTSVPTVEVDNSTTNTADGSQEKEKSGIKKFWPFKKKDDKAKDASRTSGGLTSDYTSPPPRSTSPGPPAGMSAPTSPARGAGASPRIASPASSQIFERNVQEESLAPAAVPSAIPSHITTENHIPPALDASSMAITDQRLDPDKVEIFTHVAHTPAAVTVAQGTGGGSTSGIAPSSIVAEAGMSPTLPATSEEAVVTRSPQISQTTGEEGAASYGALDSTDVRRLSFISFADVVHAEQSQSIGSDTASGTGLAPHSSLNTASMQPLSPALSSTSPMISSPLRSASPIRAPSPSSAAALAASPSLSVTNAASPKIIGANPSPPTDVVGELAVETMGQALRKTGSGDLGLARDREREVLANIGSAEGLGLTPR